MISTCLGSVWCGGRIDLYFVFEGDEFVKVFDFTFWREDLVGDDVRFHEM